MTHRTSVLILVPLLALAGCAQDAPDDDTPVDDPVVVATEGVPTNALPGVEFTFTLKASGRAGTTDHLGGHFGRNSTTTPSTAAYSGACKHQNATVPGTFTVRCTIPESGTWYLRGHVRLGSDPSFEHFWGPENRITVGAPADEYVLTTTGVPQTVEAGEEFSFTLAVVGAPGTSDHIGGHFGRNSTTTPSAAVYTQACIHQAGTLPGTFTVRCTIPEPGTWYLRGHTRTGTSNETYRHFWAAENTITAEDGGAGDGTVTDVGKPAIVNSTAGGVTSTARFGSTVVLCWTVEGTGNVPHVAVHWDDESHADEDDASFAAYALGASYPGNATAADPAGYDLDADGTRFCTGIEMPDEGKIFVVAHAIDATGGLGKLSDELEITGTPI